MKDYLAITGIFFAIGLVVGGLVSGFLLRNVYLIIAGTLGAGVVCAILGIALKFLLTSFEHRTWCY